MEDESWTCECCDKQVRGPDPPLHFIRVNLSYKVELEVHDNWVWICDTCTNGS